jgi:hypothetical protein
VSTRNTLSSAVSSTDTCMRIYSYMRRMAGI